MHKRFSSPGSAELYSALRHPAEYNSAIPGGVTSAGLLDATPLGWNVSAIVSR